MIFKQSIYLFFFSGLCLLQLGCSKSKTPESDIPVITDPMELRNITETSAQHPRRVTEFIPQGDGTVIDQRTGLQWMRCSLGQIWTQGICRGFTREYTWEQANKLKWHFADYGDWRLPTIWELETLIHCRSGLAPLGEKYDNLMGCKDQNEYLPFVQSAFPLGETTSSFYWSENFPTSEANLAWGVDISNAASYPEPKGAAHSVRLVRRK